MLDTPKTRLTSHLPHTCHEVATSNNTTEHLITATAARPNKP